MNIEAQKFTLEMSHNELWSTAFDVRRSLETALKEHWINHQSDWQKHEAERLHRMKKMFLHLGRPDLYEEIFEKAVEVFKSFNDKRVS